MEHSDPWFNFPIVPGLYMLCLGDIGDMLLPNSYIQEAIMSDEPVLLEIFTDYV